MRKMEIQKKIVIKTQTMSQPLLTELKRPPKTSLKHILKLKYSRRNLSTYINPNPNLKM